MNKNNITSTEQISKYHPDKVCDQISDAILTEYLKKDLSSHVACETMVKGSTVIIAGEITSNANIDRIKVVKRVMKKLRYPVTLVHDLITTQSPEINNAVTNNDKIITAGDQGMMYGYACEGENFLPFSFNLANKIINLIEWDFETNKNSLFIGDAKTQIIASNKYIKEILISTCFDKNKVTSIKEGNEYLRSLLLKYEDELNMGSTRPNLILNPSGLWTFGGPAADCGLTGRKIVCDSYGGFAPVGGGAFSGKDPTKVDRSGAYIARKIACDVVSQGYIDCNVILSYGIGIANPRLVNVIATYKNKFGSIKRKNLSEHIKNNYDLTPMGIINNLDLFNRNYEEIAAGCHMIHFM